MALHRKKIFACTIRVYFQNLINPLLVLLRKTGFFDRIYTHVYGKTKFRFKKMHLRELSGSKFHYVTSSNVILYNDVKTKFSSKLDSSGFGNELFLHIAEEQNLANREECYMHKIFWNIWNIQECSLENIPEYSHWEKILKQYCMW